MRRKKRKTSTEEEPRLLVPRPSPEEYKRYQEMAKELAGRVRVGICDAEAMIASAIASEVCAERYRTLKQLSEHVSIEGINANGGDVIAAIRDLQQMYVSTRDTLIDVEQTVDSLRLAHNHYDD